MKNSSNNLLTKMIPDKPPHINELEFMRILTPYVYASKMISGKYVLDAGCNLGYGTQIINSNGAYFTVAFDIDKIKVIKASESFSKINNCKVMAMDIQKLGFKSNTFDIVTCFEVIEHVPAPEMLLSEIKRILKTYGILLLSTPNRNVRLFPWQKPWNQEHLREYSYYSLEKILRKHFPSFTILGIYGKCDIHTYYIALWRNYSINIHNNLFKKIIKLLTPSFIIKFFKKSPDNKNIYPIIDGKGQWPFFLDNRTKNCLNFLAVCASNETIVKTIVNGITLGPEKC